MIFLLSIAQINEIDLDSEVQTKIETNAERQYVRSSNGKYWQKHSTQDGS